MAVNKTKTEAGLLVPSTILDYGSKKLKRVVKSSLAAEVQAFAETLDQQMVVRHMISTLLGKHQQVRKKVQNNVITRLNWQGVQQRSMT